MADHPVVGENLQCAIVVVIENVDELVRGSSVAVTFKPSFAKESVKDDSDA